MTLTKQIRDAIINAVLKVHEEASRLQRPSIPWSDLKESSLWNELVTCILGSRVRHEVAVTAADNLKSSRLIPWDNSSSERPTHTIRAQIDLDRTREEISEILSKSGYPFHKLRAHHICRTYDAFYGNGRAIRKTLLECETARVARSRIVDLAYGIGPKQASLFLTSIGYTKDISILDAHVMRYLAWMDLIPSPLLSLNTLRKYEEIEEVFLRHAGDLSVPAGDLDLAVWIVASTAKQEFRL